MTLPRVSGRAIVRRQGEFKQQVRLDTDVFLGPSNAILNGILPADFWFRIGNRNVFSWRSQMLPRRCSENLFSMSFGWSKVAMEWLISGLAQNVNKTHSGRLPEDVSGLKGHTKTNREARGTFSTSQFPRWPWLTAYRGKQVIFDLAASVSGLNIKESFWSSSASGHWFGI